MYEQNEVTEIKFAGDDFATNPEPRCPCVLVLDVSVSMSGDRLNQLNDGLQEFRQQLQNDGLSSKRVEVAVVTFGPVKIAQEFVSARDFNPPHFLPQGATPMGEALLQAMTLLDDRKKKYRDNGVANFRPWIFLITDGAPTDAWTSAAQAIHKGEQDKKFAFFAIGVQDADMHTLGQIGPRAPVMLKGLMFKEMFLWLSNSLAAVSRSSPGDIVAVAPPIGWTSV